MQIEIFYNQGGADILPLVYMSNKKTAQVLARQISICDLVYSVRLRTDTDTEDFRNGQSEHDT